MEDPGTHRHDLEDLGSHRHDGDKEDLEEKFYFFKNWFRLGIFVT